MGRVRINFMDGIRPSEGQVLDTICDACPVSIRDLHMGVGHCIIVVNNDDDIDLLQSEEIQEKLFALKLKVVTNNSNKDKVIFVSKVRPFMAEYEPEDIIQDVNRNNNVDVKALFIIKRRDYKEGQPIALKIIFNTVEDTDKILQRGIKVKRMSIPPIFIHKEEPIVVIQCFKCFNFGHNFQACKSPHAFCSQCAGKHNYRECTSEFRKCILCGDAHLAVARECIARKEHIRNLNEEQKTKRNNVNNNSAPPPSNSAPQPSSSVNPNPPPPTNTSYPPLPTNPNHLPPLPSYPITPLTKPHLNIFLVITIIMVICKHMDGRCNSR